MKANDISFDIKANVDIDAESVCRAMCNVFEKNRISYGMVKIFTENGVKDLYANETYSGGAIIMAHDPDMDKNRMQELLTEALSKLSIELIGLEAAWSL